MRNLLENRLIDERDDLTYQSNMAKPNLFDQLVDQYKLEKHLAQGGVTDIYLAFDVDENRQVAVEILLPYLAQNKSFTDRFVSKMRQVSQIKHRHISQVLQVGITPFNNRPYFAREYIESFSLRQRLQQLKRQDTPVNSVYALKLVRQIAEALALAERLEIFHHDLQPEKVMIQHNGNVILADLGVPRLKNVATDSNNAHQDPNYWSHEQIQGKSLTARSHVYSLGVILFELLTGELPATSGALWGNVKKSSSRNSLAKLRTDLSKETYHLINRSLRIQTWSRYSNCKELIAAIDEAIKAEEFLIGAGATEQRQSVSGLWLKFAVPLVVLAVILGIGLLFLRGSDNDNTAVSGSSLTSAAIAENVATATSTPTPVPTETSLPVIANVTIFEPAAGQKFIENETIQFNWTWLEPLKTDEQFLVQVLSSTQNFVVSRVLQPDDNLTYKANVPGSAFRNGPGTYEWQVVLISPDSGSPIAQSDPREIVIVAEQATSTPEPSITPTAIIMETATPSLTPTVVPQVVVIVSSASLREGPSTDYNVVTYLEQGDVVIVIGINREGGNWYNVIMEDGTPGWVSITVVEPIDETAETAVSSIPIAATIPATPTPTNTPTPTPTLTPTPVPPSSGGGNNGGGGSNPRPTLTPPPP